jgi:hypothetical protein
VNLYSRCPFGEHAVRVPARANTRAELPSGISLQCTNAECSGRNVPFAVQPGQVFAWAPGAQPWGGGALLAIAGGLLAGPFGIGVGGVLGAVGGQQLKKQDAARIEQFNQS